MGVIKQGKAKQSTPGTAFLQKRQMLATACEHISDELGKRSGVIRSLKQSDADMKEYGADYSSLPYDMATLIKDSAEMKEAVDNMKTACEKIKQEALEEHTIKVEKKQCDYSELTAKYNDQVASAKLLVAWKQDEFKKQSNRNYFKMERFAHCCMLPDCSNTQLARAMGRGICAHTEFLQEWTAEHRTVGLMN